MIQTENPGVDLEKAISSASIPATMLSNNSMRRMTEEARLHDDPTAIGA